MHLSCFFNSGIGVTLNVSCSWNKWNIWALERLGAPGSARGGTGTNTKGSLGKRNLEGKHPGAEAVAKNIILGSIWNIAA